MTQGQSRVQGDTGTVQGDTGTVQGDTGTVQGDTGTVHCDTSRVIKTITLKLILKQLIIDYYLKKN